MGKISLLAGAVEGMIYGVADWLGGEVHGIDNPRRHTVGRVRNALASTGTARALADAVEIDVPRWSAWLESARVALEDRNEMIHARLIYVSGDDGRVQFARTSRDGRKSPRPAGAITAVRVKLESVADEGDALHLIAHIHGERWSRRAQVGAVAGDAE